MTFAQEFIELREIESNGRVLRQVWQTSIPAGILRIARVSSSTARRQGFVVDADADLSVAGRTARRFVLWADAAPRVVEIAVPASTDVRIWNVWADDGLTQAWLGWAAIHADEVDADVTRLSCTDGHAGQSGPLGLVIDVSST